MKSDKRSPLKRSPLRVPGQSVEEKYRDVFEDSVAIPLAIAVVLVCLAIYEWWRDYVGAPYAPKTFAVMALAGVAYAVYRTRRALPTLRSLHLARDGERAVGQYLEELRGAGYHVLHDILGEGFNVDHVVIGPPGILTVETKTFSKRGNSKVTFNGHALLVDGWEPDRDPIVQAKAQARWLGELLQETTGRTFKVRPVVLFPGWFVEHAPGAHKEVWVLNPKALKSFLDKEPVSLATEDIKLATAHLSRYVRAGEALRRAAS